MSLISSSLSIPFLLFFCSNWLLTFCREFKKRLQPRYPNVAYIPDRFVVVVLATIITWKYGLDQQGLAVLGEVNSSAKLFSVHFPFDTSHLKYVSDAINTALIIAMLGFFESSVAAKSLGSSLLMGCSFSVVFLHTTIKVSMSGSRVVAILSILPRCRMAVRHALRLFQSFSKVEL